MSTFNEKQQEEQLKELELRLDGLEKNVCDTLDPETFIKQTSNVTNLAERLEGLVKKYKELENDNDDIKHLVEKYQEYESFLEKDFNDNPHLHTNEKKAILLSAFDDFKKIQENLAEVESLYKITLEKEDNPIQDLHALELKVSKQEIQTQNLLIQCVDFKKELEQFLSNYNDLVNHHIFFLFIITYFYVLFLIKRSSSYHKSFLHGMHKLQRLRIR